MRLVYLKSLLVTLALTVGLSHSAQAQDLDVTQSSELDFGTILDAEGTGIIMSTSGSITADPDGIHLGGSVQAGVYVITGGANCEISGDTTDSEANNLKIYQFTSIPSDMSSMTLASDGTLTVTLGASLDAKIEATVGLDWPLAHSIKVNYSGSCSGNDAEVYFNGRVDVQQALGLSETTELDFGTVADNDGTITLGLSDSITSDANDISVGGTIASGIYTCTGAPNKTFSMSLTGSSKDGLTIGSFTSSEADLSTVSLGGSGSKDITLGADLTVTSEAASAGADQALSFTVTLNYN